MQAIWAFLVTGSGALLSVYQRTSVDCASLKIFCRSHMIIYKKIDSCDRALMRCLEKLNDL